MKTMITCILIQIHHHGHDDEIFLVNYETFDDIEHELQISPNYKCQEADNPPSVIDTPTFCDCQKGCKNKHCVCLTWCEVWFHVS
jgi:hypothetical protein